jgi:hypothetical protein
MVSVNGTGFAGSEINSAKPVVFTGASKASFPSGDRYKFFSTAALGGQASKERHLFVPVSKTCASGNLASPSPFRKYAKNFRSMFS